MTLPAGSVTVSWVPYCTVEVSPAAGLSGTVTVPFTVIVDGVPEHPARARAAIVAVIKARVRFTVVPLPDAGPCGGIVLPEKRRGEEDGGVRMRRIEADS